MLNHLNARMMTSLLVPVVISWFIHIYDDKGSVRITEYKMTISNEILAPLGPGRSLYTHILVF